MLRSNKGTLVCPIMASEKSKQKIASMYLPIEVMLLATIAIQYNFIPFLF
jgi:hypothetical protein